MRSGLVIGDETLVLNQIRDELSQIRELLAYVFNQPRWISDVHLRAEVMERLRQMEAQDSELPDCPPPSS